MFTDRYNSGMDAFLIDDFRPQWDTPRGVPFIIVDFTDSPRLARPCSRIPLLGPNPTKNYTTCKLIHEPSLRSFLSLKFTSTILFRYEILVFLNLVSHKMTPYKFAPYKFALDKSAPDKSALYNFATYKSAPDKSALYKSASDKFAPDNFAPDKFALDKSALDKSAPDKSFLSLTALITVFFTVACFDLNIISPVILFLISIIYFLIKNGPPVDESTLIDFGNKRAGTTYRLTFSEVLSIGLSISVSIIMGLLSQNTMYSST